MNSTTLFQPVKACSENNLRGSVVPSRRSSRHSTHTSPLPDRLAERLRVGNERNEALPGMGRHEREESSDDDDLPRRRGRSRSRSRLVAGMELIVDDEWTMLTNGTIASMNFTTLSLPAEACSDEYLDGTAIDGFLDDLHEWEVKDFDGDLDYVSEADSDEADSDDADVESETDKLLVEDEEESTVSEDKIPENDQRRTGIEYGKNGVIYGDNIDLEVAWVIANDKTGQLSAVKGFEDFAGTKRN